MKKINYILFLLALCLFAQVPSYATHVAGGDVSYECIGPNQFRVTVKFFRDCTGVPAPSSINVSFTNTCGFSSQNETAVLQDPNTNTDCVGTVDDCFTEISQLCTSVTSTCNGGAYPGMKMYKYVCTVTLANQCDTWTMSYSVNARNCSCNLAFGGCTCGSTGSSDNFYTEATLRSQTAPCNNSPVFTAQPIPYVCLNQPVYYSFGVVEPDGDSLVYLLVDAKNGVTTNCTYTTPYSATYPIDTALGGPVVMNPNTGLLTFIPDVVGNWVVAVRVDEYDPITLQLKGSSTRDIQFITQTCSNAVPSPAAGSISNLTGTATQTGPFNIEMCEGQSFCFDAVYTDSDAGDTLTALTNLFIALPGATMTTTGTNPITCHFCWTAPAGSALTNNIFTVAVKDDACPVVGITNFIYEIFVSASTLAGNDTTICGAMEAHLHGTGGTNFNWTALPGGDPIIIGTNFSCNPCQDPIATPTTTTTYVVVSDLTTTCNNTDTVTVFVNNTFSHTLAVDADSICLNQDVQMHITTTVPGTFTYVWTPGANLNDSSIANPIANFNLPGVYEYHVVITNSLGCFEEDSMDVYVSANYPTPATATISQGLFCLGDSAQLGIQWGGGIPPFCLAPSTNTPCGTPQNTYIIDTGTNNNTTPSPFTGNFQDGHLQVLYKTSELLAAGFLGGTITELSLNVATKNSSSPYHDFTVKMGCTPNSVLTPGSFESGLTTVFGGVGTDYSTVLGTNNITLTSAYDWNGVSNLVIEFCYNNTASAGGADIVSKTVTTDVMSLANTSNVAGISGCNLGAAMAFTMRPNINFKVCPYPLDTTLLFVHWTADSNVTGSLLHNPWTTNDITVIDTLTIINPTTGCITKDTILVRVSNPLIDAGPDIDVCFGGSTTLNATGVNVSTYSWSPATDLSSTSIPNPVIATLSASHTYTLTVTDVNNCTDMDVINVNLHPLPTLTFTSLDSLYCNTAALDLMTATPVDDTAAVDTGYFTGPGIQYNLSTNQFNFSAFAANVGTHYIYYHYSDVFGCTDSIMDSCIVIPFNNGNPISYSGLLGVYCITDPVDTMIPNISGGSFSGPGVSGDTFNPATAGAGSHQITFTYTDANNCTGTYFQTVTVNPLPTVVINNLAAGYCNTANNVTLQGTPGSATFQIDGNNGNIIKPKELAIGTHTVTLSYTSSAGCFNQVSQTFEIYGPPSVDAGAGDSICSGSYVALTASGASTYLWTPSATLNDSISATTIANPIADQWYKVYGTDSHGCVGFDSVFVAVMQNPVVSITATPTSGIKPLDVAFTATQTNVNAYNWNFDDGGSSTDQNPSHTFDEAGLFLVVLNVENFNGECTSADTVLIQVSDSIIITEYNIFTPNSENENNMFKVKTVGIENIDVDIFNRWGRKVGEYHGVNNGWDGKMKNGKLADDGVYYYIAKAVGYNKEIYDDLKGFFHLVAKQ